MGVQASGICDVCRRSRCQPLTHIKPGDYTSPMVCHACYVIHNPPPPGTTEWISRVLGDERQEERPLNEKANYRTSAYASDDGGPSESFPPVEGHRESRALLVGLFFAGMIAGMLLLYGIRG